MAACRTNDSASLAPRVAAISDCGASRHGLGGPCSVSAAASWRNRRRSSARRRRKSSRVLRCSCGEVPLASSSSPSLMAFRPGVSGKRGPGPGQGSESARRKTLKGCCPRGFAVGGSGRAAGGSAATEAGGQEVVLWRAGPSRARPRTVLNNRSTSAAAAHSTDDSGFPVRSNSSRQKLDALTGASSLDMQRLASACINQSSGCNASSSSCKCCKRSSLKGRPSAIA
mmetsp:Transcript_46719/g.144672  ORF Transcript_46719/g.144672 Transcript_46719/m.144672 type:complete len:227 (-) Transcript_46719:18-698(-)